MLLHRLDHVQQLFAADQFNRLAFGKALSVCRVSTDAGDLDRVGLVMRQQAVHLPHHADANLLALPLLALHQCTAAVLAQNQVDAAVCATQAGFFDAIALPAKGFAHQLFEPAPAASGQALQGGTCLQKASPAAS
ncbi:hypothetical protein Xbuh_10120 [Xanthomonas axonopodis pv. bauhiniae]|nr:hypothetical protein Xbuh_10120 [Xanthomonas axonopodis pv. bauhiniae]